jgi:hypothetical protein
MAHLRGNAKNVLAHLRGNAKNVFVTAPIVTKLAPMARRKRKNYKNLVENGASKASRKKLPKTANDVQS